MSSLQTMHDVFMHELRDLYSAEKMLVKALPKMARNAANAELADALTNHLEETKVQVERLEEIFTTLGEKKGGVKCKGMEGLIEEGDEVLQMEGVPVALDAAMIGAAQRVEHYEMAAYGSAISLAHSQGHTEAARLLEATLKEEEKAEKLLTSIADRNMADSGDTSLMGTAMGMVFPRMHVKPNGRKRKSDGNGRKSNGRKRTSARTR